MPLKIKRAGDDEYGKYIKLLVCGSPGSGKCLTGETEIVLEDGSTRAIGSFKPEELPKLWSMDGGGRLSKEQSVAFVNRPAEQIYRLELRSGKSIRGTKDHRFFDGEEWTELGALHSGDLIATPRELSAFGNASLPDNEVALLGLLIADGGCTQSKVGYTKADSTMRALFIEKASAEDDYRIDGPASGRTPTVQLRGEPLVRWKEWCQEYGIACLSKDKEVPSTVFTLNKDQLAIFLAVLWSGDGSVSTDRHRVLVSYSSASEKLIDQVQHLWLRFGIVSCKRKKFSSAVVGGTKHVSWELGVWKFSLDNFMKYFGDKVVGEKGRRLNEIVATSNWSENTNIDVLPWSMWRFTEGQRSRKNAVAGRLYDSTKRPTRHQMSRIAAVLGSEQAAAWANSDIFWDEIVSIEPDGFEETYCFIMPSHQPNFVANDIVVHNTSTAATWANVLFADVEGGLMSVAHKRVPFLTIETSGDLLELMVTLDQQPEVREKILGIPVETVVIDTVDEIARILTKERLESTKQEAMKIQDWGWLGDQLRGILRGLRNLPLNVVFTCHTKDSEDSETGRVIAKPAIPGAVGDEIAAYVDIAVLLTARPMTKIVNGENERYVARTMQTYPDLNHPWIKDRSGELPMEFPINFENDFARMHALIYGVAAPEPEAPKAPVVVSKPVQTLPTPVPPVPTPVQETPTQAPVEQVVAQEEEIVVPTSETVEAVQVEPAKPDWMTCQVCSGEVEDEDQSDLSRIRFRKSMCRKCFIEAKNRK